MYVVENRSVSKKGKVYRSVLLRESYREGGKVKNRTVGNLSHCSEEEIRAIKLALQHKDNLSVLSGLEDVKLQEGPSVGAVWVLYEVAKELGIEKVLSKTREGKLALWQVLARVIDQGSRFSAVRLAQTQAACEVLNITETFNEEDLYENLDWLCENQDKFEKKLFLGRYKKGEADFFLYDATSSYLEGEKNELADWGYNRDKKKGKKQIVIGLLCDKEGEPVSVKVFRGNTQDISTFSSQIHKAAEEFGCQRVTFVGDRGMIKSGGIEQLKKHDFHYITAITKAQIGTLIKAKIIELELFDSDLCEVETEGIRYILRKNPLRAQEIKEKREEKFHRLLRLVEEKNQYLKDHSKAKLETAFKKASERAAKLKIDQWIQIEKGDRSLSLKRDNKALEEIAILDGCYVLKTDLPKKVVDKETIHRRYKDLSQVEWAFRTMKTGHLDVRPVFVRKESRTRGHAFVVMLAYMIIRRLTEAWRDLEITVEEGIEVLKTICSVEVKIGLGKTICKVPDPRPLSQKLLEALKARLPVAIPARTFEVVTKKKLVDRRRSQ